MNRLMNSAMMPKTGSYRCMAIHKETFADLLKNYPFESYIGYQDTADHIKSVSGVDIPLNRSQTTLEDGDCMIVCKLKYRVASPSDKGRFTPSDSDYEYFLIEYEEA